jgi:hypothetical protein
MRALLRIASAQDEPIRVLVVLLIRLERAGDGALRSKQLLIVDMAEECSVVDGVRKSSIYFDTKMFENG